MSDDPRVALFADLVGREDDEISVPAAALVIARVHYPDLALEPHLDALGELAETAAGRLPAGMQPGERVDRLRTILFDELRFSGDRDNYYDCRNLLLNDVIERRLGIPITLAILYMEIATACGAATEGVGFPGHFLVRDVATGQILDPFHKGLALDEAGLKRLLAAQGMDADAWSDRFLEPITNRQILLRLINNLARYYQEARDTARMTTVRKLSGVLTEMDDDRPSSLLQ